MSTYIIAISNLGNTLITLGFKMLGVVYTGVESPQDWLEDVWTCGTLASAYVLCHLSAMWL